MTAQKDLEQMKWYHIRSLENNQIVESENLNLRRAIVELRGRNAEMEGALSNSIKLLRDEMSQIRIIHSRECGHTNDSFDIMKKATAKLLHMASERQNQISALSDVNDVVSQSLSDLTASNLQEKVKRQKAITNSESKILKLRDSLIVIETDNSKLIKENEDSKDSLIQLSSKNDALIAECARLKAKNAKTETDFNASVEDAIKNQDLLKQACDEHVLRNSDLEKQNSDLHNELAKLRADFAAKDNMSHFAKFVAIKSENSFLKSQLKNVQSGNAYSSKGGRVPQLSVLPFRAPLSARSLDKERKASSQTNNINNLFDFPGHIGKGRTHEYEESNKNIYVAERKVTDVKMSYGSKIPAIQSNALDDNITRETSARRHSAPHEIVHDMTDITVSPRFCSRSINSRWDADDLTPCKEAFSSNISCVNSSMQGMSLSYNGGDELNFFGRVGITDRVTVFEAMKDDTSLCDSASMLPRMRGDVLTSNGSEV